MATLAFLLQHINLEKTYCYFIHLSPEDPSEISSGIKKEWKHWKSLAQVSIVQYPWHTYTFYKREVLEMWKLILWPQPSPLHLDFQQYTTVN